LNLNLKRIASLPDAMLGILLFDGRPHFTTLELPWKNNEHNVSCIPAGNYDIQRIRSPKFGETFEVVSVPGRSGILFHCGNSATDSTGCILLGMQFSFLPGRPEILYSKNAHDWTMRYLFGTDRATLKIE
jgi:hypothetical protein